MESNVLIDLPASGSEIWRCNAVGLGEWIAGKPFGARLAGGFFALERKFKSFNTDTGGKTFYGEIGIHLRAGVGGSMLRG